MFFHTLENQRAAATLLAATASSFLPILSPIQGVAFSTGFYYDFLCKQEVDSTLLTLLTEEMRRKIQQKVHFELFTFVPQNAAHFLEKNQPIQAATLSEMDVTTVELIKCESFYDISFQSVHESSEALREFLLYEIEKKEAYFEGLGDVSIVRIHGAVFTDRKSVKNFVKQTALAAKNDPVVKAEEQKLLSFYSEYPSQPIWQPKGVEFYAKIKERWKKLCDEQEVAQIAAPMGGDLLFLHDQYKKKKHFPLKAGQWFCRNQTLLPQECEGLFQTLCCKSDKILRVVETRGFEKEFISSLQFIHGLLSMIGLEIWHVILLSKAKNCHEIQKIMANSLEKEGYPVTFEQANEPNASPRLELRAKDLRAREWQLSQIEVTRGAIPDTWLLSQVSVFSLERVIALMLERGINVSIR